MKIRQINPRQKGPCQQEAASYKKQEGVRENGE